MITIRAETAAEHRAVRRVNELAFDGPGEATLVEALREEARPYISLVAVSEGDVVGHVFFSPVTIEAEEAVSTAMALGPMAVLPAYQRQGIGSQLVREGLKECLRAGQEVVFVLGHPHYYPRFGFAPASAQGLRCLYPVPDEVFMVTELRAGALAGRRGIVRYHPAFDSV